MNILADKQKWVYEKGISEEERERRFKEFNELYYSLRTKDESKIWHTISLEQRKKLHWLILSLYKLKNRIGGFNYELLNDLREPTDRPIIFAVTHVEKFDIEVVSEAITDLRDTLSTLKWEIWESEESLVRKELDGDEWEKYVEARFKEWPYFNQEYIDGLVYKPKGVVTPKEAFSFMEELKPSKENAFLLRKK